ncbi:hypothetical protein QBC32DRAFT_30145 [Pseudoneurospora amorphoporcata]|uniref:Yeast cell wall synthesis Kre9/Knh1-like N-terminal domain-containing protein n=1 Tax=Pseudoneurospora amorphoporcata TaxID=241081 RepID=A0AAN6NRN8_9PEZI|nr:hypothetical protein QBC32DRAFT_30145 [Pseudoneurospora amorphoporcata]
MRSTTTLLQALFATSALAIKITHPEKNDVVDVKSGVEVSWTTVNTDPKSAHLVLVNMASGHTPYSKDLGEVDLTKGSIIISESDVPNDSAFQFNFQSVDSQSTGILAQSEQFEVKNSEDDKKEPTTTKGAKTSAPATLVTASEPAASASATASTSEESSSAASSVSGASTLATVTGSATGTASGTASATAVPTGAAGKLQSGSFLALAVGLVAVLA